MSFLYVIAVNESGPVKLGISGNPQRRLKQLQTGHPEPLQLFYTEPIDAGLAYYLERHLHKDLRHKRVSGEWFALTVPEAIGHVQFTLIEYAPSELIVAVSVGPPSVPKG